MPAYTYILFNRKVVLETATVEGEMDGQVYAVVHRIASHHRKCTRAEVWLNGQRLHTYVPDHRRGMSPIRGLEIPPPGG